MSRENALSNIRCTAAQRWGRTEYSLEYHDELVRKAAPGSASPEARQRALFDSLGLDFMWGTDDGIRGDWGRFGRATDMGHAEYAANGSDMHAPKACPFKRVEEVWAFDPDAEYGLPGFDEQVRRYRTVDAEARAAYPGQFCTGGYYKTIVSGAIAAFGWDMLLEAAADRRRFEIVLDRFYRRTLFHMKAWAATDVEAVIQHDDFVWTSGPFMDPAFYRAVIIPRYAELWKPIHAAGKKVLFCSDGNFSELASDIVAAGADGLIFEPCNDFGSMAERFGDGCCLVGSAVDCRDLTFGRWDSVQDGLERTAAALRRCSGAILAVGNHIPANVPDDMVERYNAALATMLERVPASSREVFK